MQEKTKLLLIILFSWIFFPLVAIATLYAYFICWTFYLLYARTDAPPSQSKVPFSPIRVYKVTLYLLNCLCEMVTAFIPSMLGYCWHSLSSKRKEILKKSSRYGPNKAKVDVYYSDRATLSPVIIFINTSLNTGKRGTCMPVAQNLQNQGYVVVVPDITLYPKGKIAEMVADVQQCIYWTNSRIIQYGGDPSQIYLMGHSAGVLLSALTVIHDVCASLNVLPVNNSNVQIPIWDKKGTRLPRLQGLIFFSGIYDVTYYHAYLHHLGFEQIHSMPRVMGNTPESLLQCSPSYLLNHALNNIRDRERLTKLLPKRVLLIHGAQDTFNPPVSTKNFFHLLDSVGVPSVQLKIYEDIKYISPCKDLIIPNKRLCILLSDDIKECCQNNNNPIIMNNYLNERRGGGKSEKEITKESDYRYPQKSENNNYRNGKSRSGRSVRS
ncbi:hypothetical protein Glove_22g7 [Diversispora epigaea]|uniref:BD-FAE-like domain-containing protein n=1 Tax=Diversispora epigaea TaxID=1348612 RepID=A0A397JRE4_9GLOM|nr:hypothetical protein Glove_22g7 [Diversispora epigaea]